MKIVVELSEFAPCCIEVFTINGREADLDDFGEKYDMGFGAYSCGFDKFEGKAPTAEVLNKYQIRADDYAEIVEYLKVALDEFANEHGLKDESHGIWKRIKTPEGEAREYLYMEEIAAFYLMNHRT